MTPARPGQPPIYAVKAEFFRALGHPARIRLLQQLREGERTVGALQTALDLDSSGASQQLAALRKRGLVESRREGTSVYYRVKDPRTLELLELAKRIISANLEEGQVLLDGLAAQEFGPPRGRALT
jgi:ArsR family transcriptional regulator